MGGEALRPASPRTAPTGPAHDLRPRPLGTLPARLALICVRHHLRVLLLWLLLLGAGAAAAGPVMDGLDRRPWSVAAHESVRGNRLLDAARPYGSQIDAVVSGPPVTGPGLRRELAAARRDLAAIPGVHTVTPSPKGPTPPTAGPFCSPYGWTGTRPGRTGGAPSGPSKPGCAQCGGTCPARR